MAVGEGRCAAAVPGACSEEGKSRRAVAGIDGDDDPRLLRDQEGVAGDGDAADEDGGSLSLAVLPAEADPNVLLAAGCCCCCCSGVVGSDDIPCLRDEDLRKLLSGDSNFGESPFSIASFLSNELPSIAAACFELSQLKKLVKNAGSSPSATAYTVVSVTDRGPSRAMPA